MSRAAILVLLSILALGAVAIGQYAAQAHATVSSAEAILTYPISLPTPTMGGAPAPAPALASVGTVPLAPPAILASWQVLDTPASLPGEGGRWVERQGHVAQDGLNPAASLSAAETALLSPDIYDNVAISASYYDEGNGTVGLIARHSDRGFYRVRLHTDPTFDGEALMLEKMVDGVALPLVSNHGEPLYQRHSWHTLTLSFQDNQITVTLDGQVVAQVVDAAPLPAGRVGLYARALGGMFFDQVTLAGEEL